MAALNAKLEHAIDKLSVVVSQASEGDSDHQTPETPSSSRKRSLERSLEYTPIPKRVTEPPLLLPNNSTSPSVLVSIICCFDYVQVSQVYS